MASTDLNLVLMQRTGDWYRYTLEYRRKAYDIQIKTHTVDGVPANSFYGVKGGKLLKLWIKNIFDNIVLIDYDRGFNVGSYIDVEKGTTGRIVADIENMLSENRVGYQYEPFGLLGEWERWIKR